MPSRAIGQESPKWFGMRLATGNIMNIKNHIEESSTPMNYLDRISSRAPLTHKCYDSEVSLIIDFEN
jgi:hypothetical protein